MLGYLSIEDLRNAPEGEHFEFKEAKTRFDFTEAVKYCCALSNCGGGKFILGISDKRPRIEAMATDDLLVIHALFHEQKISEHLRSRLKRLIDFGIVEHVGRNTYVLARSLYEVTGKSGIHTRLVGLDRETNKELILKHIRKNGESGTPFRELEQVLPSHSRNQIKVLMRELQRSNQIHVVGNTSSAKWYAR